MAQSKRSGFVPLRYDPLDWLKLRRDGTRDSPWRETVKAGLESLPKEHRSSAKGLLPAITKPIFVVENFRSKKFVPEIRWMSGKWVNWSASGRAIPGAFFQGATLGRNYFAKFSSQKKKRSIIFLGKNDNSEFHSERQIPFMWHEHQEDQPLRLGGSQETAQALTIEVSRAFVRIQELLPIAAAQRTFYRPPVTNISSRRDPLTRWTYPSVLARSFAYLFLFFFSLIRLKHLLNSLKYLQRQVVKSIPWNVCLFRAKSCYRWTHSPERVLF